MIEQIARRRKKTYPQTAKILMPERVADFDEWVAEFTK